MIPDRHNVFLENRIEARIVDFTIRVVDVQENLAESGDRIDMLKRENQKLVFMVIYGSTMAKERRSKAFILEMQASFAASRTDTSPPGASASPPARGRNERY